MAFVSSNDLVVNLPEKQQVAAIVGLPKRSMGLTAGVLQRGPNSRPLQAPLSNASPDLPFLTSGVFHNHHDLAEPGIPNRGKAGETLSDSHSYPRPSW